MYVAGTIGQPGRYDYGTLVSDASNGHVLWLRQYDGPISGDDYGIALEASPSGSTIYVTGSSAGGMGFDFETLAYTAT